MLTNKQKVLLFLINELSIKRKSSRFMIVKSLFLLKKEEFVDNIIKFYNFYPYKYGPFSRMIFRDIIFLRSRGFLDQDEKKPSITQKGIEVIRNVSPKVKQKTRRIIERFNTEKEIEKHIYKNYPDYTVKSEKLRNLRNIIPFIRETGIFTIGYESKDLDYFLDLLIRNKIDMLIDVRRNPFSMNFSFKGDILRKHLENIDIEYKHLPSLGIESELRKNISTSAEYKKLFRMYKERVIKENEEEINEIISIGKKKRIVLMCFESNKNMCHRGIISHFIENKNIEVTHL